LDKYYLGDFVVAVKFDGTEASVRIITLMVAMYGIDAKVDDEYQKLMLYNDKSKYVILHRDNYIVIPSIGDFIPRIVPEDIFDARYVTTYKVGFDDDLVMSIAPIKNQYHYDPELVKSKGSKSNE